MSLVSSWTPLRDGMDFQVGAASTVHQAVGTTWGFRGKQTRVPTTEGLQPPCRVEGEARDTDPE